MSTVRASKFTQRVYQAPAFCSAVAEVTRGPSSCLSRQLVDQDELSTDGNVPWAVSHQSTAASGLHNKFREVRTHANWGIRFHWHAFQDPGFDGSTPGKDAYQSSMHHQPLVSGRYGVSTGYSQDAGHHSVYGTIGLQRTSQVQADPMVGQRSLGPNIRRLGSENYSTRLGHPSSLLVGVASSVSRAVTQDPRQRFYPHYWYIHPWMGGSTEAQGQNHINILEMKAVYCAIRGFLNRLHGAVWSTWCMTTLQ